MICVASFFVLLVLSIFSARYRVLLKKAWHCVTRRVTFRPCDTSFGEEVRSSILAPLAVRAPGMVKPASAAIQVFAWLMVATAVVSVYVLLRSGLNLAVYGTCNKQNSEACGLAAAQCSVGVEYPTFLESLGRGDVVGAFRDEFVNLADTFSTIPSRFRDWQPEEFAAPYASYKDGYRPGLPVALEVLDPGCVVCAQLYENVNESGLGDTVNMTYILFPIMEEDGTPHFPNSVRIANLLTAIRIFEYHDGPAADPTDWRILSKIFTGTRPGGDVPNQMWFNEFATPEAADEQLREWLTEFGYTDAQIADVFYLAGSDQVAQIIEQGRYTVRNEIRTVSIPTLLVPGRMYRGIASVDSLRP